MDTKFLVWILLIIGGAGLLKVIKQLYDEGELHRITGIFLNKISRNRQVIHKRRKKKRKTHSNSNRNSTVNSRGHNTTANYTQVNTNNTNSNNRVKTREIGPMVYYASKSYGLSDSEYRFLFVKKEDSWRAYIKKMPNLQGRDASGLVTHRLWDENNKAFVCWNTPILNLSEIQSVSKLWADKIQKYISTGEQFG